MLRYKGYREQGLECDRNGNRLGIEVPYLSKPNVVLVCVKHKTYCHSKACLKDRMK